MSEMNPSSSVNESNEADVKEVDEIKEPDNKKIKLTTSEKDTFSEKLEHRLGGILCCAVCLDLPKTAIYQVCIICITII